MSRYSFKKLMPHAETIKNSKSLGFLGDLLDNSNLFHFNRKSVSKALFWGTFIGLLPPVPIHTPAAAMAALLSRANLPLAIAACWIANPITIPFIMYAFYNLGRVIFHLEPAPDIEFTWSWLVHEFEIIWRPYLLGSIIGATSIATLVYFSTIYLWRVRVKRKWMNRKKSRTLLRNSSH